MSLVELDVYFNWLERIFDSFCYFFNLIKFDVFLNFIELREFLKDIGYIVSLWELYISNNYILMLLLLFV